MTANCNESDMAGLGAARGSASEDAALNELGLAAIAYADAYRKDTKCSSFFDWSDACNRLESAALQWSKTQMPNDQAERLPAKKL